MAKVTNPLNSTEARGRVGGLVYNTWRGLHTVKTHTPPGHQDDPKRQAHKAIVTAAGQRWQTLTQDQRDAWNHFAGTHPDLDWTGKPLRLAGYHWYVRIQTRRQDHDQGYDDNPPTIVVPWMPINIHDEPFEDEIIVQWDTQDGFPELELYVDVFAAGPHSAGRNATLHDATRVGYTRYEFAAFGSAGHPAGWYTLFLRCIHVAGLTGPWQSIRTYLWGT
jgi:hypothetical protein